MDIQYIKTNIDNMNQNELLTLLSDMIMDNVHIVENFNPSKNYRIGDRVYIEESNTHCVYQCITNNTTGPFNRAKWIPLVEVYTGPAPIFYSLRILEEVHIPKNNPTTDHTIQLDYKAENSTVAIYKGKYRLVHDVDFTLNGKTIHFNKPIPVGERIIIEVRERLGVKPNIVAGIVLYDINDEPYNVLIDDEGNITVNKIDQKDNIRDIKRATLIYGDKRYTLMVNSGVNPAALGLFEEVRQYLKTKSGKIYSIEVTGNSMSLREEPYMTEGTEYIMGTDKKFYNFEVENGNLVAYPYNVGSLEPLDHNIGFRLKSTDFKDKMVDVVNGSVRLINYMPNIAYHNIMLKSKGNNKTYRITLNSEFGLEMHDDLVGDGTHSPVMDELYFYNHNLNNFKLYIENDRLIYETCSEVTVRDSRGINIINSDGVLSKIIVIENDKIDTIKFADLSKMGSFNAPLDKGLVVMEGNTKKLISVDLNGDTLVSTAAPTDAVFKTNDHYIFGTDSKLYKFTTNGSNVGVELCAPNEFVMENKHSKMVIRCNDVINVVDASNGRFNVTPVSTFTHTLKSTDGRRYLLDVTGERGQETIVVNEITPGQPYYNNVGLGCIYLKNNVGEYYKGIVQNGTLVFTKVEHDPTIDYDITSIAYTSKGWFKLDMKGNVLTLRKIFNNMYYPGLCYEVSREFVLTSENDKSFSLYTNGNGDLIVKPADNIDVPGVFFRSSDDRVYCLGVMNNSVVTYRSFIERSVIIEKAVYMKDILTGKYSAIYMNENRLVIEAIAIPPSDAVKQLFVYNDYGDSFIIVLANGELMLVEDILERAIDKKGNKYRMGVERHKLTFTLDNTDKPSGYIKLTDMITGDHYNGFVDNGILSFEVSDTPHNTPTQAIHADGKLYVLSMFEGRVSMVLINENNVGSVNEEYVPRAVESKALYDGIRLYNNLANTEGCVVSNMYDVDSDTCSIKDVDLDSNRAVYALPIITTDRPKTNVIGEINEMEEEK